MAEMSDASNAMNTTRFDVASGCAWTAATTCWTRLFAPSPFSSTMQRVVEFMERSAR